VSATDTLALIESGELALCVLLWVVLMRGGGEPEVIERWKRLVEREPDLGKRAAYRHFALEFAELIPELVNWQRALEGWEVRESQYSKSIEARGEHRGELRARRADLLKVLGLKLKSPAPEPVRLAIEGTNDLATLDRWLEVLFEVDSWTDFQSRMKQP
jgi:hypothetical protein